MVKDAASLRILHIGDTHIDDPETNHYLEAIEKHIAERQKDESTKYHAMTSPGDFLQLHSSAPGTANRSLEKVIPNVIKEIETKEHHKRQLSRYNSTIENIFKRNNIKEGETQVKDIDERVMSEIQDIIRERQKYVEQVKQGLIDDMITSREFTLDDSIPIIENDYQAIGNRFQRIKDLGIELLAVPGNHDTKHVYAMDTENNGPFTFVDTREKVTLTGYDGTEFIVQGDPNTFEIPPYINRVLAKMFNHKDETRSAEDFFLNYDSGLCLDPKNQCKPNRMGLDNLEADQKSGKALEIKNYQTEARDRMRNAGTADIYLTHKITEHTGYGTGDVAAEYSKAVATVLAGHQHGIQIGEISNLQELNQAIGSSTEIEEIDGYKVKVLEFDPDEALQLNGGTEFAFEVVYGSNKKVKEVIMYQVQQKAA